MYLQFLQRMNQLCTCSARVCVFHVVVMFEQTAAAGVDPPGIRAIAPSYIKLGISLCIKWMFQQKLEIAQKQDMPNFLKCAKQSVLERLVFLRFSVWKWCWPINRPYIILSTLFWFKICLIKLKGGVKICSLVSKQVTIYNCVLRWYILFYENT